MHITRGKMIMKTAYYHVLTQSSSSQSVDYSSIIYERVANNKKTLFDTFGPPVPKVKN